MTLATGSGSVTKKDIVKFPSVEFHSVRVGMVYAAPVNRARAEVVEMRETRGRRVEVSILAVMIEQ